MLSCTTGLNNKDFFFQIKDGRKVRISKKVFEQKAKKLGQDLPSCEPSQRLLLSQTIAKVIMLENERNQCNWTFKETMKKIEDKGKQVGTIELELDKTKIALQYANNLIQKLEGKLLTSDSDFKTIQTKLESISSQFEEAKRNYEKADKEATEKYNTYVNKNEDIIKSLTDEMTLKTEKYALELAFLEKQVKEEKEKLMYVESESKKEKEALELRIETLIKNFENATKGFEFEMKKYQTLVVDLNESIEKLNQEKTKEEEKLNQEISELQRKVKSLEDKNEQVETFLQETIQSADKLSLLLEGAENKIRELIEDKETLQKKKDEFDEKSLALIRTLKTNLIDAVNMLKDSIENKETLSEEYNEIKSMFDTLIDMYSSLEKDIGNKDKELKKLLEENKKVLVSLQEATDKNQKLTTEIEKLKFVLSKKEDTLSKDRESYEGLISDLRKLLEEEKNNNKNKEEQINKLNETLKQVALDFEKFTNLHDNEVKVLNDELDRLQKENKADDIKYTELKTNYEECMRIRENIEKELKSDQLQLKEYYKQILDISTQKVEAEDKLSDALKKLETSFADTCLDSEDGAKNCINKMEEKYENISSCFADAEKGAKCVSTILNRYPNVLGFKITGGKIVSAMLGEGEGVTEAVFPTPIPLQTNIEDSILPLVNSNPNVRKLIESITASESDVDNIKKAFEGVKIEVNQIKSENLNIVKEVEQLQTENESLRTTISNLKTKLDLQEAEKSNIDVVCVNIINELNEVKEKCKNHDKLQEALQKSLTDAINLRKQINATKTFDSCFTDETTAKECFDSLVNKYNKLVTVKGSKEVRRDLESALKKIQMLEEDVDDWKESFEEMSEQYTSCSNSRQRGEWCSESEENAKACAEAIRNVFPNILALICKSDVVIGAIKQDQEGHVRVETINNGPTIPNAPPLIPIAPPMFTSVKQVQKRMVKEEQPQVEERPSFSTVDLEAAKAKLKKVQKEETEQAINKLKKVEEAPKEVKTVLEQLIPNKEVRSGFEDILARRAKIADEEEEENDEWKD